MKKWNGKFGPQKMRAMGHEDEGGLDSVRDEKILILFGSYGDGHQQAAKAIYDSLTITKPNIEGVLADFMELAHPYMHPISRYFFLQGVKKFPSAYGFLFNKSRNINPFSDMLKKFNRFGSRRLLKLIETLRPSIVVSTFPLAAGAMSALKELGLTDIPAATVITDHTDHSSWVHPYTDRYIVGSDFVKQALQRYGVSGQQISVTGIPIRMEFNQPHDREILFQKHGLDSSMPTLLFMGGGCGLFEEGSSLLQALEDLRHPIQLLMVCGRNQRLERELNRKAAQSKHRIQIKGYIDYIHELMAVADLMVTKPGGLTISEALAMNLPMLLYKPIPGQEEDNAQFLLQSGAALKAENLRDLMKQISKVLQSPERLRMMKEQSRRIQKKGAAFEAIEVIMKTRREYKPQSRAEQWIPSLQI
jgi:processive 1,2-diacylglycerol beta-glucosyltransferase